MKKSLSCVPKNAISHMQVERTMSSLEPTDVDNKAYFSVEINGKDYPVKQVITEVTGIKQTELVTIEACKILEKLDFPIKYHKPKINKYRVKRKISRGLKSGVFGPVSFTDREN